MKTLRAEVAEAIRQIWVGDDEPTPHRMADAALAVIAQALTQDS